MPIHDNFEFWKLWKLGLLYNPKKIIKYLTTFYVTQQLPNNFQFRTLEQMGQMYAN
jgi:hypothetical protein